MMIGESTIRRLLTAGSILVAVGTLSVAIAIDATDAEEIPELVNQASPTSPITTLSTQSTQPSTEVMAQQVEASQGTVPADPAVETIRISELVDPNWVTHMAAQSGIPERALAAYAGAYFAMNERNPGCQLKWNTLAAIGFVESGHGSINGAQLNANGVVSPPVIGIALDGVNTAAIPDTEGGRLDGDVTWDRAVGPMQFIPSTWNSYAMDGSGDGIADVHQIDDAALSAASYLCAAGGDLSIPENWIAAVAAYNQSIAYNNQVVEAANYYGSLS